MSCLNQVPENLMFPINYFLPLLPSSFTYVGFRNQPNLQNKPLRTTDGKDQVGDGTNKVYDVYTFSSVYSWWNQFTVSVRVYAHINHREI